MKKIKYIGNKIRKTDTIGPNPHRYVWEGNGAVIDVEDKDVARFLLHPAIWELVTDDEKTVVEKVKEAVVEAIEEAPPPIRKRRGSRKKPPPLEEDAPQQVDLGLETTVEVADETEVTTE